MVYEIKMTNKLKRCLIELNIYHQWLYNTHHQFYIYKKLNWVYIAEIKTKEIDNNIKQNDIKGLLINSFDWVQSKEGYSYWNEIYKKIL